MLNLLIIVGRLCIIVAAFITITFSAIAGWLWGMELDVVRYGLIPITALTPNRIGLALLGLWLGIVIAGSLWGLAAAIFDMQLSLRAIANAQRSFGPRSEPRL